MRFAWSSQKYLINLDRKSMSGQIHLTITWAPWELEQSQHLSSAACVSILCIFTFSNKISIFFKVSYLFIFIMSLTCHESKLLDVLVNFKLDEQQLSWSSMESKSLLKRLLRSNINWNKIVNIQTRLNVLTIITSCTW